MMIADSTLLTGAAKSCSSNITSGCHWWGAEEVVKDQSYITSCIYLSCYFLQSGETFFSEQRIIENIPLNDKPQQKQNNNKTK